MNETQEIYRREQHAFSQIIEKQVVKVLVDENTEYNKQYNKLNGGLTNKEKKKQELLVQNADISSKFTKFFYDMFTNKINSVPIIIIIHRMTSIWRN